MNKNKVHKRRTQVTKTAWQGLALAAVVCLAMVFTACSANGSTAQGADSSGGPLKIVTTIAQIAEPIAVIGGEHVQVESLMGPGVDPHLYTATQGDIRKLNNAEMILYSGLHLEANLVKVFEEIGKNRPVLALGDAIPQEQLLKDETGAVDPHIWFDIDLWKIALNAATEELKQARPEHAEDFEANREAYFAKMDELKRESAEKLSRIPETKRMLVTAHDAFGYFGRMLDLKVVGLQGLSTEAEIGLSDIEETVELLLEHQVPAVFVESSINPASINAVIEGAKKRGLQVERGGELFSDAMGEQGTAEGTYLGMYRHNVETIYAALSGEGTAK